MGANPFAAPLPSGEDDWAAQIAGEERKEPTPREIILYDMIYRFLIRMLAVEEYICKSQIYKVLLILMPTITEILAESNGFIMCTLLEILKVTA